MNMINILDLPQEVNIMIIKLLDIQSQENVYNTCTYFKNIVSLHGVVTSCKFCMNMLATANSLKLDFFKDIAGHLRELNLCTVNDLTKTSLIPAMKKMKRLNILDVSYTRINIIDLLDIYKACPTIKDITINFAFDKTVQTNVAQNIVEKCQSMFEHFERVHFVGALVNLFYSKLPLNMLCRAKLNELLFTITDCALLGSVYENEKDIGQVVQFKQMKLFLLNWHKESQYYGRLNESVILKMLDLKKCELIIVTRCTMNMTKVMVSPRFKDFFEDYFGLKAEVLSGLTHDELGGNVAIMIWNTESTVFNEKFFENLSNQITQYFPYHLTSACSETQVPAKNDWFYTKPSQHDFGRLERKIEPDFKRRRLAPQDVILNYDTVCKDKKKIQISLMFDNAIRCPVTLSSGSHYLRKITHLSLTGNVVYSSDFFKTLFFNCNYLVAINCTTSPNASQALGRYIPLCKYIKHLRIVATTIDFKLLFQSLSQCRYMENVHLYNLTSSGDIAEPKEMFERCFRMYNLSICMPISDSLRSKKLHMLNKLKSMFSRDHLNIELYASPDSKAYGYDPFIDVFNLNPIKVL